MYEWIDGYCTAKPGVTPEDQADWQATRYVVGGKMFAMAGQNKAGEPIFTVKLEPKRGEFLREQFAEITPGYYMNKLHWNSVSLGGTIPEEILKGMIDEGYAIVFQTLPKKTQREILQREEEK